LGAGVNFRVCSLFPEICKVVPCIATQKEKS
jgi:hypothetical protein